MEIQSPDCRMIDHFPIFENDTIQVAYIFWSEDGVMGIFIHNKLNVPIYIDWKKCSFITGLTKHDYWDENISIVSSGNSSTTSKYSLQTQSKASGSANATFATDSKTEYWTNFIDPNVYSKTHTDGNISISEHNQATSESVVRFIQNTFNYSLTRILKPERITFIPPHTTFFKADYSLVDNSFNYVLQASTLQENYNILVPQKVFNTDSKTEYESYVPGNVQFNTQEYKYGSSFLSYRSFLTYSLDEKFSSEGYIDNSFYVSKVIQIPYKYWTARLPENPDSKMLIWAQPNSFFVKTK